MAMAGERMKPDGFTEVSGVCAHPDHRGRGFAGALMRIVAGRILARGETPFLHAYASNRGAIGLYESLGFRLAVWGVDDAVRLRLRWAECAQNGTEPSSKIQTLVVYLQGPLAGTRTPTASDRACVETATRLKVHHRRIVSWSMKRFVEGEDRRQEVLLPEFLDDRVSEEKPVRAIDMFVRFWTPAGLGAKRPHHTAPTLTHLKF